MIYGGFFAGWDIKNVEPKWQMSLFIDKDTSYNEGAFFSEIFKMCLDAFYYFYVMYIKCLSWKQIIFGEKKWILVGICNVVTISEISLK